MALFEIVATLKRSGQYNSIPTPLKTVLDELMAIIQPDETASSKEDAQQLAAYLLSTDHNFYQRMQPALEKFKMMYNAAAFGTHNEAIPQADFAIINKIFLRTPSHKLIESNSRPQQTIEAGFHALNEIINALADEISKQTQVTAARKTLADFMGDAKEAVARADHKADPKADPNPGNSSCPQAAKILNRYETLKKQSGDITTIGSTIQTIVELTEDNNERQQIALAHAVININPEEKPVEFLQYCRTAARGNDKETQLLAFQRFNPVFFKLFNVSNGDKFTDRDVNTLSLIELEFSPKKSLKDATGSLYHVSSTKLYLVFEERINILLSTLLDPKCTYADFEIFDFETKAALIKEFPVVVAKKAQELVARKYSPPKDAEQTTKKLALDDLANALTAPTDQKAGGATKTLEASVAELAIKMRGAINTATTPITEKPNFSLIFGNYRSSDTGNFFIAVVKATEFLTRELMSLKNHRLCELLGKEVAVTAPAPAAASAAPAQPPTL